MRAQTPILDAGDQSGKVELLACQLDPTTAISVSYTHLDVYKRQLWTCYSAGEIPIQKYGTDLLGDSTNLPVFKRFMNTVLTLSLIHISPSP